MNILKKKEEPKKAESESPLKDMWSRGAAKEWVIEDVSPGVYLFGEGVFKDVDVTFRRSPRVFAEDIGGARAVRVHKGGFHLVWGGAGHMPKVKITVQEMI